MKKIRIDDIVLIIETLTEEFGRSFWDFIKSGGYEIREKRNEEAILTASGILKIQNIHNK